MPINKLLKLQQATLIINKIKIKIFRYRESNPSLLGESQLS